MAIIKLFFEESEREKARDISKRKRLHNNISILLFFCVSVNIVRKRNDDCTHKKKPMKVLNNLK